LLYTIRKIKHINFNKNFFEKAAWDEQKVVTGIDEVGRGCLAGPVVTAAVILPINKPNRLLLDSKLLTPEERVKAYNWIVKHCWYGVGITHHRLIDQRNIWQATLIAMKKALVNLLAVCPQKPSAILIDAMPLNLFDTDYKDIPVHYFPIGERKSSSIAAASIVAKVTRDRMMEQFDIIFPGYKLKDHKGYSTPTHKKLINVQQHTIIHRLSYLDRLKLREANMELSSLIDNESVEAHETIESMEMLQELEQEGIAIEQSNEEHVENL
jgi:ribonuclease HII